MRKIKSFVKKTLIVTGILSLAGIVVLIWFFVAHDAPILKGEVLHQISYKKDLTLDIYQPTEVHFTRSPLVVFFHGGAWIMGIKESININRFNGAVNTLRQAGYAVISPEYTLAENGKSPFPDCITDASDLFAWIVSHAEQYNFDLDHVGVFGESAGAHIAMMTAYANTAGTNDSRINLAYVVDVYGPTDLFQLYHNPTVDSLNVLLSRLPSHLRESFNITKTLFGFDPGIDSARTYEFAMRLSPLHLIDKTAPATLVIHGDDDRIVPVSQSQQLVKKLEQLNVDCEFHELEGVDHAFIGASAQQKSDVQRWIVAFIKDHYNERKHH